MTKKPSRRVSEEVAAPPDEIRVAIEALTSADWAPTAELCRQQDSNTRSQSRWSEQGGSAPDYPGASSRRHAAVGSDEGGVRAIHDPGDEEHFEQLGKRVQARRNPLPSARCREDE